MKKLFENFQKFLLKGKKWISIHQKTSIFLVVTLVVIVMSSILLINSRTPAGGQVTYRSVKITRGDITQAIDVVGQCQSYSLGGAGMADQRGGG